jgi:hypothetical protein
MNCCICSGVCNHTGPHSYCAAHSVDANSYPVFPVPSWPTVRLPPCEHCYCQESSKPEHLQCCKCGTIMHAKFVASVGSRG